MKKIQFNLPQADYKTLRRLARQKGVSIAWLLRAILANPRGYKIRNARRPTKFREPIHRFNLCLHDDKTYWLSFVRTLPGEFGPYIRALIRYYLPILHEIDFMNPIWTKTIKKAEVTYLSGGYAYHVNGIQYDLTDYWALLANGKVWHPKPG